MSSDSTSRARGRPDVRDEDTFDVAAVAAWLRDHADAGGAR